MENFENGYVASPGPWDVDIYLFLASFRNSRIEDGNGVLKTPGVTHVSRKHASKLL